MLSCIRPPLPFAVLFQHQRSEGSGADGDDMESPLDLSARGRTDGRRRAEGVTIFHSRLSFFFSMLCCDAMIREHFCRAPRARATRPDSGFIYRALEQYRLFYRSL
mmetsp:Transcript_12941/g.37945  ORF Transcript_12941/g.37945 Transcript_12941/m.37945 type:complete len:106 (+) Transcript_12941:670-987(+)